MCLRNRQKPAFLGLVMKKFDKKFGLLRRALPPHISYFVVNGAFKKILSLQMDFVKSYQKEDPLEKFGNQSIILQIL